MHKYLVEHETNSCKISFTLRSSERDELGISIFFWSLFLANYIKIQDEIQVKLSATECPPHDLLTTLLNN